MDQKERILLKAHELFNRYGIRSVTMDEIATQIGMSKKTIYQVFSNKDELVNAIIEDHITKNQSRCECDSVVAKNAIHQVFLSMDMVQEMYKEINPITFMDLQKFHPGTFQKLNDFKDMYLYKIIKSNLEWGIKEGLYRDDLNLDIMIKLRLNTMFLPFNQDIFPMSKYNLVDVENHILEHFIYGLATPKAEKLIVKYKAERIKTSLYEKI